MSEKSTIVLDDETTWPRTVLKFLDASASELAAERAQVADRIHALIEDLEIVGYHCSRLADDEIARIKVEGLCPLTEELRRSRVNRRVEAGDLSPEMADRLLSSGIAGDNRLRLVNSHFFFTKEVVKECFEFFRYWGGESIYLPHIYPGSEEIKEKLSSLGVPCIVEVAVPVSAIQYHSVAYGLLYEYGRRRSIRLPEDSYDSAQESMRVLRVIQYGSPEFVSRTRDISWPTPIYP